MGPQHRAAKVGGNQQLTGPGRRPQQDEDVKHPDVVDGSLRLFQVDVAVPIWTPKTSQKPGEKPGGEDEGGLEAGKGEVLDLALRTVRISELRPSIPGCWKTFHRLPGGFSSSSKSFLSTPVY